MGVWSIYISDEEEKLLKKKIQQVATKHRWSFSQAVSGILKEYLIDAKESVSSSDEWNLLSSKSFFSGYSSKDSIYDDL